jgi:hypothetical protein
LQWIKGLTPRNRRPTSIFNIASSPWHALFYGRYLRHCIEQPDRIWEPPHKGRSAFKTYGLYLLAAICWIPVVLIQIRMKGLLERQSRGETFDAVAYAKLFRLWFALGWPAFGGLVIIFWLMVTKPTW